MSDFSLRPENRIGRVLPRALAAAVLLAALFLASCVSGPDYKRPAMDAPANYKSATEKETEEPGLGLDWWRLFNDAELNTLAEEALQSNQDLKAAMARVEQARASARSVKSSFYPAITMSPSATRSRTPVSTNSATKQDGFTQAASAINEVTSLLNEAQALAGATTTTPKAGGTGQQGSGLTTTIPAVSLTNNRIQVPFDLSYEIDLWGRVRRSYEAAEAQTMVSQYDLEVVRQTLLADLAQDYFNLRSLDARNVILKRNIELYRDQVDLTDKQFRSGLTNVTNVLQAKVQLESTQAQAADVQRQRTDLEHAIAILLGRAPAQFDLGVRPLDARPPEIPAGLPGDVLRRRPDVAEAEQNLAGACANIGVAQANFFPTVTLTGSAGFQSSGLTKLVSSQNLAWSMGPSINLPIFKGGQLRAELQKAKARYDELEATYRKTVLTAFGDVENSLTDLHLRADASEAQGKAVADAREYLRFTQMQYDTGTTDYLHVIDAEKTLLTNELSDADISGQRMVSTVLLIKALGGGWEPPAAPVPEAERAENALPGTQTGMSGAH